MSTNNLYFNTDETVIYNDDCLNIMRQFKDNHFDITLTDPPYGIGADKGAHGYGSSKTVRNYDDNWDQYAPTQEYFDELLRVSCMSIIFGAIHFTDKLPISSAWIVWDKVGNIKFKNPFSDCELAWTNYKQKSIKKYICLQQGFISEERRRFHGTQKPIKLFSEIIKDTKAETIFDPFMGSGTSIVAAKMLGKKAIGVEILKKYCRVATERVQKTGKVGITNFFNK